MGEIRPDPLRSVARRATKHAAVPFSAKGCFTALVTPFTADGAAVDWGALDRLLEAQLAGGIDGLVPCGTTGEAPTLSESEQTEVVRRAVSAASGRVPVVAGTGSNDTKETIRASRAAFDTGADAVLVVMPYYNRPSQEGLFRHVELVASSVGGPIVLYNIPVRTAVDLGLETLERILFACPNVVALKDASGNVHYCQAAARFGDRLAVLSGDDALTVPMMSVGATGVISVTSNLYPRETTAIVCDMRSGRWDVARAAHLRLLPVHAELFTEPSPGPIKAALAARGRCTDAVRPPMAPMSVAGRPRLTRLMDAYEGR
jgi:4-hydroxy-tetrahydrodipicolinate synthase